MKTRFNLYGDEFKPQFVLISANNTIVFGLIATLIMGVIYLGVWQDQKTQQQTLNQVQSKFASTQEKLDDLTKQLALRTKDPVLLAKLTRQKLKLSAAKNLADKLDSLSELRERPFSSVLDSFVEANNNNVWLTSFKVNDKRIFIEGNISEPAALPAWLKSIGKTEFFNNRDFGAATVFRTDEQLNFTIESQKQSVSKNVEAVNE
jgi:Tfp pilus assembly protein PilN